LTLLMTSHDGQIAPVSTPGTNLARLFDLRA